jgi:transposase
MARGRQYPKELKERAVRTAMASGRPIAQVVEDLGIGSESLRKWVRQAEADAGSRSGPTTAEREEIRQLKREV